MMILFTISLVYRPWKDNKVTYFTTFLVALIVLFLVLLWSMFELFLELRKEKRLKLHRAMFRKVKV